MQLKLEVWHVMFGMHQLILGSNWPVCHWHWSQFLMTLGVQKTIQKTSAGWLDMCGHGHSLVQPACKGCCGDLRRFKCPVSKL